MTTPAGFNITEQQQKMYDQTCCYQQKTIQRQTLWD